MLTDGSGKNTFKKRFWQALAPSVILRQLYISELKIQKVYLCVYGFQLNQHKYEVILFS